MLAAACAGAAKSPGQATSSAALFGLYRARDYAEFQAGLRGVQDWHAFIDGVKRQFDGWPPAVGSAFVLEAAAEIPAYPKARDDREASVLHVAHVIRRFPGDVRFRLARLRRLERAVYSYLYVGYIRASNPNPVGDHEAVSLRQGVQRMLEISEEFEQLSSDPAVRVEALLRAGFWRAAGGKKDEALVPLRQVQALTQDGSDDWDLYLTMLFQGRALADLGRTDEAVAAYRAAVNAWPAGETARTALAASLYTAGSRDEAVSIVNSLLLSGPPAGRDPWMWFPYGDYRFWEERRDALRREVTRQKAEGRRQKAEGRRQKAEVRSRKP